MMTRKRRLWSMRPVAAALTVSLLAWSASSALAQGARAKDPSTRNAYFGETHVHTSWSFDAYIFGNHLTGHSPAR